MKILIATDGSDFSNEAIKKCSQIINKGKDTAIKIVSVYEQVPIMATEPFAVSTDYITEMSKVLKKEAENHVSEAMTIIKNSMPDTKIDLTTKVELGIPEQVIIETAQEWQADLIIVGSHGRGFWGRAMIGSTSDTIVHNAPCPVLVVRKSEGVSVKSATGNKYD